MASVGLTTAARSWAIRAPTVGADGQAVAHVPTRCTTSQLGLRRIASAAGTGNIALALSFVDNSRVACSLRGWPQVAPSPAQGHRGSIRRVRNTFFGFRHSGIDTVVLRPGEAKDAFVIAGTDDPVKRRTCGAPYRQLKVTLPGRPGHLSFSAFVPYLDQYMPACATLELTPIEARSKLRFG